MDEPALQASLDRLADADLLFVEGAPPEAKYRFKHALIQDAAYESLLKSRRQALHRRAAEALREANAEPEAIAQLVKNKSGGQQTQASPRIVARTTPLYRNAIATKGERRSRRRARQPRPRWNCGAAVRRIDHAQLLERMADGRSIFNSLIHFPQRQPRPCRRAGLHVRAQLRVDALLAERFEPPILGSL